MDAMLLDPQSLMYRFLKPAAVGDLLHAHKRGANDHHKILFSLIVFEMWLRSGALSTAKPPSGYFDRAMEPVGVFSRPA